MKPSMSTTRRQTQARVHRRNPVGSSRGSSETRCVGFAGVPPVPQWYHGVFSPRTTVDGGDR